MNQCFTPFGVELKCAGSAFKAANIETVMLLSIARRDKNVLFINLDQMGWSKAHDKPAKCQHGAGFNAF